MSQLGNHCKTRSWSAGFGHRTRHSGGAGAEDATAHAKAESPANRFAGLLRIPSFSAASVAGAAHQAEAEHEHVDEVEIEFQSHNHDRFDHTYVSADVEIQPLSSVLFPAGEDRH